MFVLIAALVALATKTAPAGPSEAELRLKRVNHFLEKFAAIEIQKVVRMILAKKKMILAKEELDRAVSSATRIQSVVRRLAAQKRIRAKNDAAVIAQKCVRMYLARKKCQRILVSTIKIQAFGRMIIAKEVLAEVVSSATKIQSVFRWMAVQKRICLAKKAAVIIQKLTRRHLVKTKQQLTLASAIKIQALFRQRSQRSKFQLLRNSAIKMQTLLRTARAKKASTNARPWIALVREFLRSVGNFIATTIFLYIELLAGAQGGRQEPNEGAPGGRVPDFENMNGPGFFTGEYVPNYYEDLGFSRDDDHNTLKKTFRRLALLHHPDKGGDPAMFRPIAEAWEVLGDPASWAAYNRQYDRQYVAFTRVAGGLMRRRPARVVGYLTCS